ncbi:MAG: hypothetical protein KAJ19_15010 [Gammaproteobacteria bacterium]|nr:hypothetical protein [Gammaproteobacteria bacterium]
MLTLIKTLAGIGAIVFFFCTLRVILSMGKVFRIIRKGYQWPGPPVWESPKDQALLAQIGLKRRGLFQTFFFNLWGVVSSMLLMIFILVFFSIDTLQKMPSWVQIFLLLLMFIFYVSGVIYFSRSRKNIRQINEIASKINDH